MALFSPHLIPFPHTSTCRPGASDDFDGGHLGVSPWQQFPCSVDFDLCLLEFQFRLKPHDRLIIQHICEGYVCWMFTCDIYFLLILDVNVIPHIGMEMHQEIDLPGDCLGLGSSEPGRKHEMMGPESRELGMVPWLCGPQEFWHIPYHLISANHCPNQPNHPHSKVVLPQLAW